MTLTIAERDKVTRRLATCHLETLRATMLPIASATHKGWLSDYALGFITGLVQVTMHEARLNDALRWVRRDWPVPQDVVALTADIAPAALGLQLLQFSRAYDDLCKRWLKEACPTDAPVGRGCLHGDRILRLTDFTRLAVRDDVAKEILGLAKEYGRLPDRHPILGRIFWSQRRARRYLILRTLGANAFGISLEKARELVSMRAD